MYRDIKANIMVNGYKSVIIKIARSVKQGDALSCALFILCIDPLIRKLENNNAIAAIPIPKSRYTNIAINNKIGAFADDVGAAVKNDPASIKAIFDDYKLFSGMSGIELNVEKTEILKLNVVSTNNAFVPEIINIGSCNITTIESIKICGITLSNNEECEYKKNVLDKIVKLEQQLIRWLPRCLTVEGKLLIVKTFGLSQLIYSMQMYKFKSTDLNKIEAIIFKFLWNRKWLGAAPDRIKRAYLKLPYQNGGLNAPDVKIMDKALKVKQFIRAMGSRHSIKYIQMYLLERCGYFEYHKLEYAKLCKEDVIISTYQQSVNTLTDYIRLREDQLNQDLANTKACVIASTDIIEYLRRKNVPLVLLRFNLLANHGVESFLHLVNEKLFPRSDRLEECATEILRFFPNGWAELVSNPNNNIDADLNLSDSFYAVKWKLKSSKKVSVRDIRALLLGCQPELPMPFHNTPKFEILDLDDLHHNPFVNARKSLKAPRDRFFKYRLLHGDVFCNSRMFKFKMVETPNCSFCLDEVETVKHLVWDCPRSVGTWKYINDLTRPILGLDYINYKSIILSAEKPLPAMEVIIVWVLRMIMAIERVQQIQHETILLQIKTLFYYEQKCYGTRSKQMAKRWGKLIDLFNIESN